MLTREKFELMTKMRLCKQNTIFNTLPKDVTRYIYDVSYDKNSYIAKLLHHIAYGQKVEAEAMLTANPSLLLQVSRVEDPAGNLILGVTPYQCALGAGDDDMAAMIKSHFTKIENGEEEEARQYAEYKKHIDTILTQKSYDLNGLMTIILKSSNEDVTAALACNMEHASDLRDALAEFRKAFAPRVITEGMHFNYQNLYHAFDIYVGKFDNLRSKGCDYDKCDLFWRQVIGYIQRGLPACDRQAFAQGIYCIVAGGEKLQRKFDFRFGGGPFPVTAGDKSFDGLGYKDAVGGGRSMGGQKAKPDVLRSVWKAYVEQKHQTCKTYALGARRSTLVCNFLK
jgi:hypothetical protein